MRSDDLKASWDRTRGHLARASAEAPPGTESSTYREFLDHNELGLALEVLADAGGGPETTAGFWEALADAADEMRLSQLAGQYRQNAAAVR